MAAQSAVVLTDATPTTPVNRSFDPQGIDNKGVAWWRYLAANVQAGFQKLSLLFRQPSAQSDVSKISFKLEVPVLETLSTTGTSAGYTAAPKVAYTLIATLEFVLPSRCSLQEREDLLAMVKDLAGETVVQNAVQNLEPVW